MPRPNLGITLLLALSACATRPPPGWVRVDGKGIRGDAALEVQYEVDVKICQREMQKANLSYLWSSTQLGNLLTMAELVLARFRSERATDDFKRGHSKFWVLLDTRGGKLGQQLFVRQLPPKLRDMPASWVQGTADHKFRNMEMQGHRLEGCGLTNCLKVPLAKFIGVH